MGVFLNYLIIISLIIVLLIVFTGGFTINFIGIKISLTKLDVPILIIIGILILKSFLTRNKQLRGIAFSNLKRHIYDWAQNHPEIFIPLRVFLLSRFTIFLIIYFGLILFPSPVSNCSSIILSGLFQWDSGWYKSIAESGYYFSSSGGSSVAFFPLYPLLIRFCNIIYKNTEFWGVVISNAAFLLSVIFLYKLLIPKVGEQIAQRAIVLLVLFPFSFFFSSMYTESVFLLLSVMAFYYAEKSSFVRASIAGGLAGLTRPTGIVLIPVLALFYLDNIKFRTKEIHRNFIYLALTPAIMSLFLLYCFFRFGEPLAFLTASQVGWGRFLKLNHLKHLGGSIADIFTLNFPIGSYNLLFSFYGLLLLASIFLLKIVHKRLGLSYMIYSLLLLLLILFTNMEGTGRYLSVIFPIFVGLACECTQPAYEFILILFSVLLAIFTFLFSHGAWIT